MRCLVFSTLLFLGLSVTLFADVTIVQEQVVRNPGGTFTNRLTLKFKASKSRIDMDDKLSSVTNHSTGESVTLEHLQHKYIKPSKSRQKEGLEIAINEMKDRIPATRPQRSARSVAHIGYLGVRR